MDKDQITIVQQGQGVPALNDNDAHIALDPETVDKAVGKLNGMVVEAQLKPWSARAGAAQPASCNRSSCSSRERAGPV